MQDIFTPLPQLMVTLSARVDHWRNYNGHNLETAVITGHADRQQPAELSRQVATRVVSPRVGALYHFADRVSVWGASARDSARRR